MKKVVIGVFNPGESPADNGRMIHALKLATDLKTAGAEVILMFEGKAVTWIPRLSDRNDDSHPFVKAYGGLFDDLVAISQACNMCCKRFDATDGVKAAKVSIIGEGSEHADIASLVLDGYQVINH